MTLLTDLAITFCRVTLWTLLSWLAGLVLGFACHRLPRLNSLLLPVVNFIRHISPFCWLPLIILIAGIGEISVGITLLISMTFHSVIITIETLRSLPRQITEQALLDGAGGWNLLWQVELPLLRAAGLDIFRVLWGVGWSAVIAAEMLGVSSGMGFRLLDFRYLLRYPEMLLYIAVIGMVGVLSDHVLKILRDRCQVNPLP